MYKRVGIEKIKSIYGNLKKENRKISRKLELWEICNSKILGKLEVWEM